MIPENTLNSVLDNLYSGDNAKIHENVLYSNHDSLSSSIKHSLDQESSRTTQTYSVFSSCQSDPFTPCNYSAYEASLHVDGQDNYDIRPRIRDGNTNKLTLLDSGSQVSLVEAGPEDKLDPSIRLESVGGDLLPCYGRTALSIQIGSRLG